VSSSLALESIILEDLKQQRPVLIVGAVGDVAERLKKLGVLDLLPPEHVVRTRREALAKATALLEGGVSGGLRDAQSGKGPQVSDH
jgi:SulP family sulfate permease